MSGHGVTYESIGKAIIALSMPLQFGSGGEANQLIARLRPIVCIRCEDGTNPGIRKRRKCRRCYGMKRGYTYAGKMFWTGWAPATADKELILA